MSLPSARWLAPLADDTAMHLAALLDLEPAAPAPQPAMEARLPATFNDNAAPLPALEAPPPAGAVPAGVVMIRDAVKGISGLVAVPVPELPYPIWLRAGTKDAETCIAALTPDAGGGRIPYQPRRLLEIGAGAGYRSVALARSFPDTEIIATEADPACEKVARLNTMPYRNVTFLAVAPSVAAARFSYGGRQNAAGAISLVPDQDGPITSVPLADMLGGLGWDSYDTVIITPDAASDSLLAENVWPDSVRMIVIDTAGEPLRPELAAAYGDAQFLIRPEGAYVLVYRREVDFSQPPPLPVPLFDPAGPAAALTLTNVPDDPSCYFPIFPHGFRLHPNGPDLPPAQLTVSHRLNGYSQINARLRVGHADSQPVKFSLSIFSEPDGREIFHDETVVAGGDALTIRPALPVSFGPCRIVFKTEMAEAGVNHYAWAEILDAFFI